MKWKSFSQTERVREKVRIDVGGISPRAPGHAHGPTSLALYTYGKKKGLHSFYNLVARFPMNEIFFKYMRFGFCSYLSYRAYVSWDMNAGQDEERKTSKYTDLKA